MKIALFGDRHVSARSPRYKEAVRVWSWAIDDAIEQGVEGFVGLGDVLETGCTMDEVYTVSCLYQRMLEHGWVLEDDGNHGVYGGLAWVQNVGRGRLFNAEPFVQPLVAWDEFKAFIPPGQKSAHPVLFLLTPYCRRGRSPYPVAGNEALETYYDRAAASVGQLIARTRYHQPEATLVVAGHWTVEGAVTGPSDMELTGGKEMIVPQRLLRPADAVVLGHIHKAQEFRGALGRGGDIVLAGSMYRTTFAERDQEKSYVLLHIENGHVEWERRALPVRPMKEVRISDAQCAEIVASLNDGVERDVKIVLEMDRPGAPVSSALTDALAKLAEIPGHYPWEIVRQAEQRTRAPEIDTVESVIEEFRVWLDATRRSMSDGQRERVLRLVDELAR